MWWRLPHNPTPYDDDFEDQPAQGLFFKWVLGLVLPLMIFIYSVRAIVAEAAEFSIDQIALVVHGVNAIALGLAGAALALFLHCHYFWGNIYSQAWFSVLGKILAACIFIASLVILIIRVGVLGIRLSDKPGAALLTS